MKEVKDLAARQSSIDTNESFLISADAGCGKTEQMARRYLNLLSKRERPESITAITFTNKATSEMLERVHKYLSMGSQKHAPSAEHLKETWHIAKQAVLNSEEKSWDILNNPGRLRITTIDSFCLDLVNKNPLKNRYKSKVETLEDCTETYSLAVENFLNDKQNRVLAAEFIALFNNDYTKAKKSLISLLPNRDEYFDSLVDFNTEANNQLHYSHYRNELSLFSKDISDEHIEHISRIIRMINEERYGKTLIINGKTYSDEFCKYAKGRTTVNLVLFCNIIIDPEKYQFKKQFTNNNQISKSIASEIESLVKEMNLDLLKAISVASIPTKKASEKSVQNLKYITSALQKTTEELEKIFTRTKKLDFTQVNILAFETLSNHPDIIADITDLLVDEFQDTCELHHRIINLIINGWDIKNGHTLCCVGDPKQSLYLFRGASLGQFINIEDHGYPNLKLKKLKFSVNFRSYASIIHWVNNTFTDAFPTHPNSLTGATPHTISEPFNKTKIESVKIQPLRCTGEKELNDTKEAIYVANLIEELRSTVPHETIAVLLRSRSYITKIDEELRRRGIKYTGIDLVKLGERQPIIDLTNLASLLSNQNNLLSFIALLRAPFIGILQKDLHKISKYLTKLSQAESLDILKEISALINLDLSDDAKARLFRMISAIDARITEEFKLPISTQVEIVWKELSGNQFTEDLQDSDLKAFFSLMSEHKYLNEPESWNNFEHAMKQLYMQPASDSDLNIQFMTIHKSKGAEMDNIIIPGCHKPAIKPSWNSLLWTEYFDFKTQKKILSANIPGIDCGFTNYIITTNTIKQLHEMVRLVYVAATRPKKRLYMSFTADDSVINGDENLPFTSIIGLINFSSQNGLEFNQQLDSNLSDQLLDIHKPTSHKSTLMRYKI